ncbi:PREDICTED: uncharacterized protein LOC108563692 [Nicrophorus vespilloides]|uniref:Uncharacterized protein LOC108563692 n=1 Tax=Nicrophorus vespilloides TaxID=110193 RepID=A0ABM1MTM9_NICVS|nr:PREDICTED: uncharacterized protein LOC108563692 [Nicrophorus vespilloides]
MVCGPKLPCNLLTTLKSTRLIGSGTERDLRLISLVLSMEYYMLLVVGTVLRNGVFFLPWLIFYSIVICLEFLLFVSRSCSDGIIIRKQSAVLAIFVVYNWLAIFCAFLHINGGHC